MKFSENIRSYRKKSKWTLAELSEITQISVAQLSKLETGKSEPSMDSLRKLSAAYGVPMSVLTHMDDSISVSPVRSGEGFLIKAGTESNIDVRYLTINKNARMQPVTMTLPPGADTGMSKPHPSDEFFYVVTGTVIFDYGEHFKSKFEKGDFLYFEGRILHRWKNIGDDVAIIFSCNDPPVM
ncbi:MAG: XRE family transcriptional regulator [bacterium]|nr:XRE family transcriptional regulator [bacterium]